MTVHQDPAQAPIDVGGVQPIAREIYRQVAVIYRRHFGPDLQSLVAHGSAVKGGMIRGSSDLDYMALVSPDVVTPGGELPLDLAMAIQRDLARIDASPFRYVQGKVYPTGCGPETGFIPGTYQVVTGSQEVLLATSEGLLDVAARDLGHLDIAAIQDRISNALLDHGEGRLARQVRGLATWIWPTMFQVATLSLGDGLAAWQRTKLEIVAILGDDPIVGAALRRWMDAISHHHAGGESVDTALEAIASGVAFLEAAARWYRERFGQDS